MSVDEDMIQPPRCTWCGSTNVWHHRDNIVRSYSNIISPIILARFDGFGEFSAEHILQAALQQGVCQSYLSASQQEDVSESATPIPVLILQSLVLILRWSFVSVI